MERVKIKPRPGKRPVFPRSSKPVPEDGAEVVLGTYWLRRIREGSIELVVDAAKPKSKRGAAATEGGDQ